MQQSYTTPRWIIHCLVFILLLSSVFPTVKVMGLSGNGSAVNPFQIATIEDLYQMHHYLNASFVLMNDLDLSADVDGDGIQRFWTPIGTFANPFRGSLDGQGYTISNVVVSRTASYSGLFGVVRGTTSFSLIQNLHITNISVSGNDYSGGLAGQLEKGNIKKVSVSGSIFGRMNVGGLVGHVSHGSVLTEIYTQGVVSGPYSGVGGVVGRLSHSTIENILSESEVIGSSCEPTFSMTCRVGGLVGSMDTIGPIIRHGVFGGFLKNKVEPTVDGNSLKVAQPIVGTREAGSVARSYYRNQALSFNGFGTNISELGWHQPESFVGFDFLNEWVMDEGPRLSFIPLFKTIDATISSGGQVLFRLDQNNVQLPLKVSVGSELCIDVALEDGYVTIQGGEELGCRIITESRDLIFEFALRGDMNLDGVLCTVDLVWLQRMIAGLMDVNSKQRSVSDFNGDGRTSATDVVALRKKLAEME